MPKLADADLKTHLRKGRNLIVELKRVALEKGSYWPEGDGRLLFHLASYVEKQIDAALRATMANAAIDLAWATRNLFELTIISDYLSRSAENRNQFTIDCDLDTLEIMEKLSAIDARDPEAEPDDNVEAKRVRIQQRTASCGRKTSRDTRAIAQVIARENEFKELYKVFSKLSHPTAWAILGGSQESIAWDKFCLYLLLRCNGYGAECYRVLADADIAINAV